VSKIVPLTIIKGAGHEHIPIPEGETAIIADFHTIQTQTKASPAYLTTGFYRVVPGPTRYGDYDYEETKYVLRGQIDVTVSSVGFRVLITHILTSFRTRPLVLLTISLQEIGPFSTSDPKPR
jgi:hypothetical protein